MVWLRCSCGEGRDMISASPAAAPVLLSGMPEPLSVVPARFQPESEISLGLADLCAE